MKITIINGEPEAGSSFDSYVRDLDGALRSAGHEVTRLDARELSIKGCSGCWGCWVKTPGECVKRDDSAKVCAAVIGSDFTILASPVHLGFTTSLLKRVADQMIPLVHPYLTIQGGEMHHRARYDRYPSFGLVLGPDADTDAEDLEITEHLWSRMVRNMKSQMAFTAIASTATAEEVAHELVAAA